jgi:hypothetical protein
MFFCQELQISTWLNEICPSGGSATCSLTIMIRPCESKAAYLPWKLCTFRNISMGVGNKSASGAPGLFLLWHGKGRTYSLDLLTHRSTQRSINFSLQSVWHFKALSSSIAFFWSMFIFTGHDASRLSKCCLLAPRTTTTGIVTRETPLLLFICTTNTNERAVQRPKQERRTTEREKTPTPRKRVGRPEGCHCQPSGQDRRASRVSAPPDRTVENSSRPASCPWARWQRFTRHRRDPRPGHCMGSMARTCSSLAWHMAPASQMLRDHTSTVSCLYSRDNGIPTRWVSGPVRRCWRLVLKC